MGTGAAIIGGSLISGVFGSKSADAQADAARQAGAVSERQYMQTRADLAPWRALGGQATRELGALYGLPYAEAPAPPPTATGDVIDTTAREVPNRRQPDARFMYPMGRAAPRNALAAYGRGGDTTVAHLSPGETVVPARVAQQPPMRNMLNAGFTRAGLNPGRYVVGGADDSINPATGMREYYDTGFEGSPEVGGSRRDTSYGMGNPRDVTQGRDGPFGRRRRNNLAAPEPAPVPAPPDDYYTQDAALGRFYQSPDYLTAFDEGQKAIERSAAGRGGLFSGNTGAALVRYGQQLGGNLYNQYANRLAGFAGLGQTAATNTGQFGANAAAQQGNALLYGGQARASGWQNIGNAINAGLSNYLLYNYLGQ